MLMAFATHAHTAIKDALKGYFAKKENEAKINYRQLSDEALEDMMKDLCLLHQSTVQDKYIVGMFYSETLFLDFQVIQTIDCDPPTTKVLIFEPQVAHQETF